MKLFIAIFVLHLCAISGLACSCVLWEYSSESESEKYLNNITAIFEGEVISVVDPQWPTIESSDRRRSDFDARRPVRIKVLRVWKGTDAEEVTVEVDVISSCAINPSVGMKATFYAHGKPDHLEIGYCSIGQFPDKRMKQKFGSGTVVAHPEVIPDLKPATESFFSAVWKWFVGWFV